MYISRINSRGEIRYALRESVPDSTGEYFVSRDLFDLGVDPTEFIKYSGRDSFYLDPDLEEIVDQKKSLRAETDLEELFWPFLAPEVRQQAELFSPKYRNFTPKKLSEEEADYLNRRVHLFDKKRLHYLRYASLSQASLHAAPLKMFLPLLNKSRDELEQFFIAQESVLEPTEFRQYVYVIYDLQRFFSETAAQTMPEGLDQSKLEEIFEKEFCHLFADHSFSVGLDGQDLMNYLHRYAIMLFDYAFPASLFEEDYARQFRDSHRTFNFPKKEVVINDQELQELFGVGRGDLEEMDKYRLTALYRERAHEHHPDKGGEHDDFVRLTELYRQLRKTKK